MGEVFDLHQDGIAAVLFALEEGIFSAESLGIAFLKVGEGCGREVELLDVADGEDGFDGAGGTLDEDQIAGRYLIIGCDAVDGDARFQRFLAGIDKREEGFGEDCEVVVGVLRWSDVVF